MLQEVDDNMAYRWFLGLSLHDPVSSASTLALIRGRQEGRALAA